MLIRFFLKRLLQQFVLCLALTMLLLAASNVFVRLPGIMSIQMIPIVFMVMLPLVALFAIPLASSLALQMVIGNLLIHDELLFLVLVKRARCALYKAVLLFTLLLMSIYAPLVFFWAPASYSKGKQMLVSFAYEQLKHLEKETFHTLIDGVTVYFTDKAFENNETEFCNIFLSLISKNREQYFFTAKRGFLCDEALILKQGSLLFIKEQRCHSVQFNQVHIDTEQLLNLGSQDAFTRDVKFKLLPQIWERKNADHSSNIEFHKRLAQLLWQLLLPFIALFLIIIFGQRKSNILRSITICGLLFFAQYMSLTLAQALQSYLFLALFLFYFPPCLLAFFTAYKAHQYG